MLTIIRWCLVLTLVAGLVGVPVAYRQYRQTHFRNFRVVMPGVLYRSGQLSPEGLKRVVHDYDIRTVVSLRYAESPGELPPDHAEEEACRAAGVRYFRVRPRAWWSSEGPPPAEESLRQLFAVIDDPANRPVLLHCFAGAHRTGVHCAVCRMEYDGWDSEAAMRELREAGYYNLDREDDVRQFLTGYVRRQDRR